MGKRNAFPGNGLSGISRGPFLQVDRFKNRYELTHPEGMCITERERNSLRVLINSDAGHSGLYAGRPAAY